MLRLFLSLFISLVAVGCGPRYIDCFPCHDDGTVKPVVALLPAIDASQANVSYSISKDLNRFIRSEITGNGDLYLVPPDQISKGTDRMKTIDFFCDDALFAQNFCQSDFIVLTELISYEFIPNGPSSVVERCLSREMLNMSLRIKIIDVRYRTPRIALQEVISCSYMVPCNQTTAQFDDCNEQGYLISAIEKAHKKLSLKAVDRIETTVKSSHYGCM